jgi:hypothetical protein
VSRLCHGGESGRRYLAQKRKIRGLGEKAERGYTSEGRRHGSPTGGFLLSGHTVTSSALIRSGGVSPRDWAYSTTPRQLDNFAQMSSGVRNFSALRADSRVFFSRASAICPMKKRAVRMTNFRTRLPH